MSVYHINSEIGKLKTVLIHEPGEELLNLIPKYLGELLFDDIPWLPLAVKEHRAFAQSFKDAGVNVVYLVDLVSESLDTSSKVKEEFIDEFIKDAPIYSETLSEVVKTYLMGIKDSKTLVKKTMAGISKSDLPETKHFTLTDLVNDNPFVTNPMPNLYFTRDPFVVVNDGIVLNKMFSKTRCRETIYGKYIFKYHPTYHNNKLFYNRDEMLSIEGGDILVLSEKTLLIGNSERTSSLAIEKLAKNLFYKFDTKYEKILILSIPKMRSFMHLDTIFTQIDFDKFTIHNECLEVLEIIEVTKELETKKLSVRKLNESLEKVLENELHRKITLIPCGGGEIVAAAREQWSDGSNTICIAPGEVIAYERNDITNEILKKNNIKVHTIPSSELSRGRGGPRCMCMPLEREDI